MTKTPSKLQEQINWYLSLVVLALLFIAPPIMCSLLYLSQVPDITWGEGDGDPAYTRVWMYRDRRPAGIGYESRRIVEQYNETEVCVENKLRFFLWRSSEQAEPATSRMAMALINNHWQPTGEACR